MSDFRSLSEKERLELMASADFWTSLNPDLTVSNQPFNTVDGIYTIDAATEQRVAEHVLHDGYYHLRKVVPDSESCRLASCVMRLVEAGIMPVFAAVYDEFWQLLCRQRQLLTSVLGEGYQIEPVIWAWYIATSQDASGWQAHRDAAFSRQSYRANGAPTFMTTWTPLTDADTYNSCMYVVPHDCDPAFQSFREGNKPEVARQLANSWKLTDIRALPAEAGDVIFWDADVLHWGGRSSRWAKHPRISMSTYYRSRDMPPFFSPFDASKRPIDYYDPDFTLSLENRLTILANVMHLFPAQVPTEPNFDSMITRFSEVFRWKGV